MSSRKSIKSAFESMMFTWGEPLDVKTAADVMNINRQEAMECFLELKDEYIQEGRGIVIRQINQSFQFVTREENADYIRRLCTPVKMKKLSQSALEVLAIVAYKQPVTKGEIEAIRGIRCDRVMDGLIKKELVCEKGRADTVGRPILYGTTDVFLKNFGFSSIKDLPEIEDIESIVSGGIAEDAEELSVMDGEGQMQMEI
ncbi:MAG: SMC-Scp complex subunit ScpB [Candidatus Fimisoma sp.]|nr:SMC-Scp complex subunit ScpB [Candidatus Fimisoma sp.]